MRKNQKPKYGPNDREQMEKDEQVEVIRTGLPENRLDDEVQVDVGKGTITKPTVDDGGSGSKDLAPKGAKALKEKVKIHPTSDVEVLDDKQVGGVPITSGVSATKSAAGVSNAVSPVVDGSRKPYTDGGYRPKTLAGKVTSDNDFIINNAISEQIAPGFEGSKSLSEGGGTLQHYNGQKQFKTARGKKNAGSLPQSILFERGIDIIKHDETIHTTGQICDNIDPKAGYPTVTYVPEEDRPDGQENVAYKNIDHPMEKSNYLLKTFSFTLDANGRISAIEFNEDKIPAHVDAGNADQVNLNWQVDSNRVTKSVLKLQTELGRETTEKWSPLGYVIKQPYQYNMLAHDIEATLGAMMLMAYRAATTAISYQSNNKLAKDGAKPVTPIVEMFLEGIGQLAESVNPNIVNNIDDNVFGKKALLTGSAAAIIKMFDSTAKFSTKANFFNLPRSLKYFLQTMDNNIDPLRCKKEFLMALDTVHTFSTPTGEYSPVLPIYATDKISVVNPLSLNYFLKGWSRDNVNADNPAGTANIYKYAYTDLRNEYDWNLKHPLVDGLVEWLIEHEANLVKAYGKNVTVTMPAFFSMLAPSMFQCILCAASYKILFRRNVIFRDYLFAGDQLKEYIYPDLTSLKELNPKYSSNMTIGSYKDPIVLGKLKPSSMVRTFWGEHYQVFGSKDPVVGYKKMVVAMPWYYNEASFKGEFDNSFGFYKDDYGEKCKMSYPELRLGVNHDYVDFVYGMSEKDLRLCLDRAVGIPLHMEKTNATTDDPYNVYTLHTYANETQRVDSINANIKVRSMRYDLNSDGRIVVHYENGADPAVVYVPNKAAVMGLPRELGFIYPAFRVSPILKNVRHFSENDDAIVFTTTGSYTVNDSLSGSNGYSAISYAAEGQNLNTGSISRTAALQQDFVTCFADRSDDVVSMNDAYAVKTGMLLSITSLFTPGEDVEHVAINDRCDVNPFYTLNGRTHASDLEGTDSVITLSKYTWTLMNRFFMPVNPFENCHVIKGDKEEISNGGVLVDPLESSFMFGVAGFLASDFGQDVLERVDRYDQLNIDYTEDAFIKDSLIFRAD